MEAILPRILLHFAEKNAAREQALAASRHLIRLSANSIRAVHRGEFARAAALLDEARTVRDAAVAALAGHADVYHAGFLHDAQKEYAEARTTLALLSGGAMPSPEALGVEYPAYLNGIAEAIGEMRRMLLDRLRRGAYSGCEELLQAMDDIYAALVTVDFPDAMTGGLRRTTDQARAILERTRGDLTMATVHRAAAARLGQAVALPEDLEPLPLPERP
ncbi:MAG: haloacid dehalogenase [Dehalococcoidia bacterium]|nr:haloacid dehalogenase [Dehalococcoidia bacterium]